MQIKQLPDVKRLNELLQYDPESGVLSWAVNRQGVAKGRKISRVSNGYLSLTVDGTEYKAHRVIWKMMTGNDPIDQIDHVDGVKLDNSWSNLREASGAQNSSNRKLPVNNVSGIKGVHFDNETAKWRATICANRVLRHLGFFTNKDAAAAAVAEARKRLHGQFARTA